MEMMRTWGARTGEVVGRGRGAERGVRREVCGRGVWERCGERCGVYGGAVVWYKGGGERKSSSG